MRKYKGGNQLDAIICNCCGKKLVVKEGVAREGLVTWDPVWDYFSERDGEIHHMDICEDCYNNWIIQFHIAVEIEECIELL